MIVRAAEIDVLCRKSTLDSYQYIFLDKSKRIGGIYVFSIRGEEIILLLPVSLEIIICGSSEMA